MSEIKRVKIDSILESQIPEYLIEENPLFVEFLRQYYKSLEHKSGTLDLVSNIKKYKDIKQFNDDDLTVSTTLTSSVLAFDDTISVQSTIGWPDTYGLLKIDDEIITYTSKTSTSFLGCIRGFSGIDSIESLENTEFLNFTETSSSEHANNSTVTNLSNLFLIKFFENFKYEFFLGFENRNFNENVSLENVVSSARDFYISKGTDSSYKFLFKVLYGTDIDILKPNEFTLKPSSDTFFVTKNLLVEKISGEDPVNTKGNFIFQNVGLSTASGSIFNVELRPLKDKNLYEISLDSSSITGTFESSGKTKIQEDVEIGQNVIIVDSTIGFSKSGKILVKPENSDFIEITYSDKTTNQFLGVSGVTKRLEFGLPVTEDKFAFSYVGFGNTSKVEFRVINLIQDVDFSKSNNIRVGDRVRLSSFGRNLLDDFKFNTWIYNIPTTHDIQIVTKESETKYRFTLFDEIGVYKNEIINVLDSNNRLVKGQIIDIDFGGGDLIRKYSNRILVQLLSTSGINLDDLRRIKKSIHKANHYSNYFPGLTESPSGVQNTYIDKDQTNFYVTSTGLPNYTIYVTDDKKTVGTSFESGRDANFVGFTSIFSCSNHNFVNGNIIYYDTSDIDISGIATGFYYVTVKDNDNIKLSFSKPDIFSQKYIEAKVGISSDTVVLGGYENKTIKNQKLLKRFPLPPEPFVSDDFNKRITNNRPIGLLANGVELLSPTCFDENIFFGPIDSIEVTNRGNGFDIVNPPPLEVVDATGDNVDVHANLSGVVERIEIISPGIGYQEKPKISISGGNGRGCALESNLVKSRLSYGFKSEVNVDFASNTISFLTNILFGDGEEVVYKANNNAEVPGLVDGSSYYVGIVSPNVIKLYDRKEDSFNKVNEVTIVGVSSGFHSFQSLRTKNTITEVYVKDPGEGFSNRTIKVPSILSYDDGTIGINTFDSYIFATNHGFKDVEVVQYSTTGTPISGLSTEAFYYVKVLDNNKFKLALAGVGIASVNTENFVNKKFINFESLGSGTHAISYPPITITIESTSAIGSTTIIEPILKPVVLGSIDDVYVQNGGTGYGCTDIINFHRRPTVGVSTIKSLASLEPIVVNGKIVDVNITNPGKGYRIDSDIFIYGTGDFAKINPVINAEGKLSAVNIIDGGIGYGNSSTTLILENRGFGAKFLANVKQWKVDQIVKSKDVINAEDDGFLRDSRNNDLGLQFCNYYIPKKLRYQLSDNFTSENKETSGSLSHSPILGFAYDGNPIYGPYGYDTPTGGTIRHITSSYVLNPIQDTSIRPPNLSPGYFTNDYEYDASGDLDEHNGRYCVTPEYPDGTYAYFISVEIDISKVAQNKYPYVIGPTFNSLPVEDNFIPSYNQDADNIFTNNITRNIGPYYTNYSNSNYGLIDNVDDNFKQQFEVTRLVPGKIENVSIFSPGDGYKVNDLVILDNEGTDGTGANIVVSELGGKEIDEISVRSLKFDNVTFNPKLNVVEAEFSSPHELSDLEPVVVSGISTLSSLSIEGIRKISVSNKTVRLDEDIDIESATGISTFIKVSTVDGFSVNDFIGIGTERLLITRVDKKRSGFHVNRVSNTGIHTSGIDDVVLLPKKLSFRVETGITDLIIPNFITFFDPKESVGTGSAGVTRTVVGFGTTTFESVFLPKRSINIPDHKFFTGQRLTYNSGVNGTPLYVNNVGSGVSFRLTDNQTVYAVNLGKNYLGLSTVGYTTSTGIGTNLNSVEFWNLDEAFGVVGYAHSLTTTNNSISGTIQRVSGIVTTKSDHGLVVGDEVELTLKSSLTEEFDVSYDNINRKLLIDNLTFADSDIDVSNNSIKNSNFENLSNGIKVVYFSAAPADGLENGKVYFILKRNSKRISLCEFKDDILKSKDINITSTGGASHTLKLVNPQIISFDGSIIKFDLSHSSLVDMDLKFYEDGNFDRQVELIGDLNSGFAITRDGTPGTSGAFVSLDTNIKTFPKVLHYNLITLSPSDQTKNQLSSDKEVSSYNKINIINHQLNTKIEIDLISETNSFVFNSTKKLSEKELEILGNANVTYTTKSKTANGPINDIKVNFGGRGYKKVPVISSIQTLNGNNAVLKLISNNIGKIEEIERIKDGFDYPVDPTLSAQLSSSIICGIKDIRTLDKVKVLTSGQNYNVAPLLHIKNNVNPHQPDNIIELQANISGSSITSVTILNNSTSLSAPLEIVPIFNSNGFEIDAINVSGDDITVELFNSASQFPLINSGYGSTTSVFPFKVGDKVFIEKTLLTSDTSSQASFNSESYDYAFFPVTAVDQNNNTVTYSVAGIATGTFGSYNDNKRGSIVNTKDMPTFEMILKDDVNFISAEKVVSPTFSGRVMENGWDNKLNQMRISDGIGQLLVGDALFGESSRITGIVEYINTFEFNTSLGAVRDKKNQSKTDGLTNDFQQRISDNYYYQKFSYSLRTNVPYSTWRESVRSIVHPSGFQEFSDYVLYTQPSQGEVEVGIAKSTDMKPRIANQDTNLFAFIDSETSFSTKSNFALSYEDDPLPNGFVDRIFFEGSGLKLKPFTLNKTNKVVTIDDIGDQFTGISSTYIRGRFADANDLLELNIEFIKEEVVSFVEFNYPNIGLSTTYSREKCLRDTGYIVEAVAHDLKYNSNNKSVEAGLAYWNAGSSYVTNETEETLFAYNYVKFIGQYVINNQTPPTLYQTAVSQVFNFEVVQDPTNEDANRYKDARNLIVANKREIQDRSLAQVAIDFPDFYFPLDPQTYERSRYADGYRLIQQNRTEIIDTAYAEMISVYPNYDGNNGNTFGPKCKRDIGHLVDAISLDTFTGGNNYSRKFSLFYFDANGVPINNGLVGEVTESVYAFTRAKDLMIEAVTNQLTIQDLTVTPGQPVYGIGTTVSNTDPTACTDVQNTISTLVGIVTAIIGAGSTSGLPAENVGTYTTGGLKCFRDLGYIIDGVAQDVSYGTNQHTIYNTTKYFDGAGAARTDGVLGEEAESIVVYETSKEYMKKAITNQLYSRDLTITADPLTGFNTDPNSCANVQTNIDTLVGILTVAIGNSSLSNVPTENYGTTDCADVRSALGNYIGIITSIIGLGTALAPTIVYPPLTLGGGIVGLTSFKLKNKGTSLFQHEFDSSDLTIVNLDQNIFNITNHNYQTGQDLIYTPEGGSPIGIATTSYVGSGSTILMQVHNLEGTAVLENGYNVAISTSITGLSTVLSPAGPIFRQYLQAFGTNSGTGTDAEFTISITYSNTTGQPLSTNIQPTKGGRGYAVGDTVSIAGTFIGGTSPTNDLTFVVSNTGPTGIYTAANETYLNVPSNDSNGAIFNVTRNNSGYVSEIDVVNGGTGYSSTDTVSIAGTYLNGGSLDYVEFEPLVLGSNKLPETVSVYKINNNEFALLGLSTSPNFLDITEVGVGSHKLSLIDPSSNVFISVDNIFQPPLSRSPISIGLSTPVGSASTTILTLSTGISSIINGDVIKLSDEYLLIQNIVSSTSKVEVTRGSFGTIAGIHTVGTSGTIFKGSLNIVGDTVYFSDAPYGLRGPAGIQTRSSFNGRAFSRALDPYQAEDTNIIFDDISNDFTGIASTEFTIKVNGSTTTTLFNDVNFGTNISNLPLIFINGVLQDPVKDFTVDGPSQNVLRFLSGTPAAGRISEVSISTSFGYQPRLVAAADAQISAGAISAVNVTGGGSGYRNAPPVNVFSNVGSGASLTATVSAAGTITSINIIEGGSGYTSVPTVVIGIPTGYSNLGLGYTGGTLGVGQDATVTVEVGSGSSIINFSIDEPGRGYRPGDKLEVLGIPEDSSLSLEKFVLTINKVQTDSFSGIYPGQFIVFEDISQFFNGFRKKFTLSANIDGSIKIVSLTVPEGSDLDVTNNIFIYVNDVLQQPGYAYQFRGSRIIFTEPPLKNSKCVILYYRGSSRDVEEIVPPKTIKEGDIVKIQENVYDPFDIDQFDRVVKNLVSSDQLETFVYGSVGIITSPDAIRPLTWTKQKNDRIISGTLFSKSRPNLDSYVTASASLIKKVYPGDTSIYVDNAFPMFSDLDELNENLRDIVITENKEVSGAKGQASVSGASTVSSIAIVDPGVGYGNTTSPKITISSSAIKIKDPIFNWSGVNVTGVTSLSVFNDFSYGNSFVAVGNSSLYALSPDGISWTTGNVGVGSTVNFKSIDNVSIGSSDVLLAAGSFATIVQSVGYANTVTSWSQIPLVEERIIPGVGVVGFNSSTYDRQFNSITYGADSWVAVGAGGSIFASIGISTTQFVSRFSGVISDLNSVAFGNGYYQAVGVNGAIVSSINGISWDVHFNGVVTTNYNEVIFDGSQFIAVGNNAIILRSISRNQYEQITTNINPSENILKVAYFDGLYLVVTSANKLYYSFDLSTWTYRDTLQSNEINGFSFIDSLGDEGTFVAVGAAATIIKSTPVFHRATAEVSVSAAGTVTAINVTDGGFGYFDSNIPDVIIEQDTFKTEKINSFKVTGDYGELIGITTFLNGTAGIGTTSPKVEFLLKSENYDNSTLGIGYSSPNTFGITASQLQKGDYFVISQSNAVTDGNLIGISTLLGGMGNYPNSKIGISTNFLDGVYIVEDVTTAFAGIVTVTCHFAPDYNDGLNDAIRISPRGEYDTGSSTFAGINTNGFYGRYSWSKIYDFDNRALNINGGKTFDVFTDNGLTGLSTSPIVVRTRPILTK